MTKKLKQPLVLIFSAVVFLALLMFAPSEITRSTGFEVIAGAEEFDCPDCDNKVQYISLNNGYHYFECSNCLALVNDECTFDDNCICKYCGYECTHDYYCKE